MIITNRKDYTLITEGSLHATLFPIARPTSEFYTVQFTRIYLSQPGVYHEYEVFRPSDLSQLARFITRVDALIKDEEGLS